jgi:hypothetical protein
MVMTGKTAADVMRLLSQRWEVGFQTYDRHIDDSVPPTGSWQQELIEELLDALTYAAKLLREQEEVIARLKYGRDSEGV